jgi:hypothetical protein
MTAISRRGFGRIVITGLPAVTLLGRSRLIASGHVIVGVSTSSFRDLPRIEDRDNVDDVIRVVQAVRASHVELALANVEPAPPNTAPVMGGSAAYPRRIVLSPEEVAATNVGARTALRTWRAQAPIGVFQDVRRKLTAAGLTVDACAVSYNESFTDEEIEATFRQVKALGASVVSSPLTMAMAARVAPFAERHGMSVAIHNQVDGNAGRLIATGQLKTALALSPAFMLKLDIGNLTAANCDAVAELHTYHPRVSHVLVKDRLRNGGASQPFGEGDSPIDGVFEVLKTSTRPIPALVEYDYVGLHPMVDEVATLVDYVTRRA